MITFGEFGQRNGKRELLLSHQIFLSLFGAAFDLIRILESEIIYDISIVNQHFSFRTGFKFFYNGVRYHISWEYRISHNILSG